MTTATVEPTLCPLCAAESVHAYRRVARPYHGVPYALHLGRCQRCGFVRLLNDPQIEYDQEYVDRELAITTQDPLAQFKVEERLAAIARLLPPAAERRFLDMGIGDGRLLCVAERYGYAAFGLDVNPAGVTLARQRYGLRAEISLEPLDQAFAGVDFDVIHMNEVIEHIAEPMPFLRACRRRLRPGGCLVVQTGNIDSVASRLKGSSWDYYRPVHVSYFSTRTLSAAVEGAGFRVRRRTTTDWRMASVWRASRAFAREGRAAQGLALVSLFMTARVHGVRRTVLIYATA